LFGNPQLKRSVVSTINFLKRISQIHGSGEIIPE